MKLTIARKLILINLIYVLVIAIVSTMAYRAYLGLVADVRTMNQHRRVAAAIARLQFLTMELKVAEGDYVISHQSQDFHSWNSAFKALVSVIEVVDQNTTVQAERAALDDLVLALFEYKKAFGTIHLFLKDPGSERVIVAEGSLVRGSDRVSFRKSGLLAKIMVEAAAEIRASNKRATDRRIEALSGSVRTILLRLILIGLVGTGMGCLFASFTARSISAALLSLQTHVGELAKGGLERVSPSLLQSQDEVGDLSRAFDRMREELESKTHQLLRARLWSEGIVRTVPSALAALDTTGKIISTNPAFVALFCNTGLQRPFGELLSSEGVLRAVEQARNGGTPCVQEIQTDLPFRPDVRLAITVTPLRIAAGAAEEAQVLVVLDDVTETRKLAAAAAAAAAERLKAEELSEAYRQLEAQARELRLANEQLESRTAGLEQVSKYKSEFLTNMSHELRTPLNSVLILAKMVAENRPGNLDANQIEYAETIHSAGADLLNLINDILDLSRIEAGVMAVELSDIPLVEVATHVERTFRQVADERGLDFAVRLEQELVPRVLTDRKRLIQILNNLLNNAFKFTEQGRVELAVSCPTEGWTPDHDVLSRADRVLAFAVTDTGMGIPEEMRSLIFGAFQQGQSGTSRQFGGAGLGLSISREIARLLCGEITLSSQTGEGSTFTLYLPSSQTASGRRRVAPQDVTSSAAAMPGAPEEPGDTIVVPDDREAIEPGDRALLIIEDDPQFARILLDLARMKGFKGIITAQGNLALPLARQFRPDAISLDIQLPGTSGWVVLDRLKRNPETRHIPVLIISIENRSRRGLSMGALGYLAKPVDPVSLLAILELALKSLHAGVGRLLIVQNDPLQAKGVCELLGNTQVELTIVGSGKEALETSRAGAFDCLILDLRLPDMSGFELLERIAADPGLVDQRVIVYTGKELSGEEQARLRRFDETIIVKWAASPEQLLSETALFLHWIEADLAESKQRMIRQANAAHPTLVGRTVLIVDDDVRNVFALTAVLRQAGMNVLRARNGRDALETLVKNPDVAVVLMDVMMPEMDGYEATRRIREMERYREVPIIALTAKAMTGDREQCIQAGASDYLAKPVDTEQLLSLIRVWLYR